MRVPLTTSTEYQAGGGQLAAADVFTRSHAWEVVERLRIDA
jgi:hypothetical protein